MKNHAHFFRQAIIFILCPVVSLASPNEIKSKSTIVAVTVYNDQALITRISKENIPAGTHKVIVTDLPWGMMDQSLKVTGVSDNEVKISDIKVDQIFLDTIPETRTAELYQRLNVLRNEKNSLERNNILYKSQFDAVDAMKESYTKSLSLQNPGQKATVEEWERLLQFVEKKKFDYTEKMESVRNGIELKMTKIKAIEDEIRSIGSAVKKEQKQISVTLNSVKPGTVTLEISYLIRNASWTPAYEVRAQSTDTSMQIVYSGNVRQSTGEDWNNVDLTLSTARPAMSENLPILYRWNLDAPPVNSSSAQYLRGGRSNEPAAGRTKSEITFTGNTLSGRIVDVQTGEALVGATVVIEGTSLGGSTNISGDYVIYNIPEGTYNVRASYIGYQSVVASGVHITKTNGSMQTFYLSSSNIQLGEVTIMSERPLVNKSATNTIAYTAEGLSVNLEESVSSTKMTSSTFSISSRQTIPGDNQHHKVGIAIDENPVTFTYTIIPKMLQTAFLVAKGKNLRNYPLLAGEANVFLDNSYVATIPMRTIMPNDTFTVNLGADEAIRVERKLLNRFVETVGTFTSKKRITYEYENTVENFKKYPIAILLQDHVPVSSNENFTVEIIEPDPKIMKPDGDGIFKWNAALKEGEKKTVKIKFAVEMPPNAVPHGIR